MIKFNSISEIEKLYPFVDAVAGADVYNGDFGTVTDGEFKPAAGAKQAVMNIENGDNEGLDVYPIAKGTDLRILDLDQMDGKKIEVYGKQVPSGVAKGDKLKSTTTGELESGATAAPYLEVVDIIGNHQGIVATVVASTPSTQSVASGKAVSK